MGGSVGPLEVSDIRDFRRLHGVFAEYKPGAVVHFTAFAYVGVDPANYYHNNVADTLGFLDVIRLHDVSRLVFSAPVLITVCQNL